MNVAAGGPDGDVSDQPVDRLLVLTSTWPRWDGDATTSFVRDLTVDLTDHGWDATALAPHAAGARRREQDGGVQVHRFRYLAPESAQTVCYGSGALANLRGRPMELAKVGPLVAAELAVTRRSVRRLQPDVIHAHWLVPQGFVAAVATAGTETPYVVTVHGGDVFALDVPGVRSAKRLALDRARAITVNSSATERAVVDLGADPAKVHRIPMGVDVDRPADPDLVARIRAEHAGGDGPLCVLVGRVVEEKGVLDVIEAAAIAKSGGRAISVAIVGEGRDRQRAAELAHQAGVADQIHFAGWVDAPEVPAWFAAADVVVAPSRTATDGWVEAQGLSIVEAMAAGRPVVATDTGGIGDAITHDETGLLVPEADPASLATAILDLYDNDERATRIADAARRRAVARYSAEACSQRMSTVLRRAAHPGRR